LDKIELELTKIYTRGVYNANARHEIIQSVDGENALFEENEIRKQLYA